MAQIGKHAFISGGGSGIGFAIASTLAAAGWRITIASRNKEKLQAGIDAINDVRANAANLQIMDITDSDAVHDAIRDAAAAHGPVQLLVNNAGGVTSASFDKTSLEAWRQTLDLNLMGTVHCVQAVLPQMKDSGWGRIVNIASTAGLTGYRYVSAYVAAKHAVVGLTKTLALELAKTGITVNAVCPGYTDTDVIAEAVKTISQSTKRSAQDALAGFAATNPQGRLVKPEEVASAVLWLTSEEAAAVNGIALPVAGGEVT